MEKLRKKNAKEFILITLLKLITVDEMGIDKLEDVTCIPSDIATVPASVPGNCKFSGLLKL